MIYWRTQRSELISENSKGSVCRVTYSVGIMLFISCVLICQLPSYATAQDSYAVEKAAGPVSVRIKDIARISCVHDIQLHGYGLVVGLNGTGDTAGATFTIQSVINMMQRFGIDVPQGRISVRNVAAVMVTAEFPFFAKAGARIHALVSSIGDAKSVAGGTLLPTPLTAPDGELYVLSQGPLSVGGFSTSAGAGNSVQKNHPTVGQVPNGGMILKSSPSSMSIYGSSASDESLQIVLGEPDFTTAMRVVSAINDEFPSAARAVDAASVKVTVPDAELHDLVSFVSKLETLRVVPDHIAEVVIDERTGTIVIGDDVRIAPVAVSHGSLSIEIKTEEEASQPPPLSAGETAIISNTDMSVQEEKREMQVIRGGASIDEVVRALDLIGVSPRDMIVILQAIKRAGALHARLVIM